MTVPVIETESAYETAATGSSFTIDKPTGTSEGDLLICHAALYRGFLPTITVPSGWSVGDETYWGFSMVSLWYYKIAGGSEPSSYTWSYDDSSIRPTVHMLRISGVDQASPINVDGYTATAGETPSVTTDVDDCLILRLCNYRTNPGGEVTWATSTEQYDEANSYGQACDISGAYASKPTAGSTGTESVSGTGSIASGYTIAIAPDGGGGGGGAAVGRGLTISQKLSRTSLAG